MVHLSTRIHAALLSLCLGVAAAAHPFEEELEAARKQGHQDIQRGIQAAEAVRQKARAARDLAGEAAAMALLGHQQDVAGDAATALVTGRDAIRLARVSGDDRVLARALYELGRTTFDENLMEECAESFQESAVVAERVQNPRAASDANTGLGRVYHRLGDLARERQHLTRALELAEQAQDTLGIAVCCENLGGALVRMREYARARELLERALAMFKQRGKSSQILYYSCLMNLAALESEQQHHEAARALLDESVAYFRSRQGVDAKLGQALMARAQALRLLGRLDESLADAQEGARFADADADRASRDEAQQELGAVHAARGEFAAAYAAEKRARAEHDSFNNEQVQRRVTGLQARYDLELQRNTIERLDREKQLQAAQLQLREAELGNVRKQRLALGGGALLGGAFLVVVLALQRKRLRAERLAREQSELARAAADETNRTKTRLLNFASHDLKAPLASLGLAARELETAADRPAEVRELAGLMRAETTEMSRLVHDFLDHSTIEAGRLELRFGLVDLAEVAARVGAELAPLARAKEQTLIVRAPAEPLAPVLGESARLGQVIGNLLSNAIKFTPTGGRIEIASGQDESGVWCEVRDSGPGIASADLARLFQPFAKLGARPTAGESSTGLGLSLARELVSRHGGVLQVESQPGEGAAFRVVLAPAELATTAGDAPPSARETADRSV